MGDYREIKCNKSPSMMGVSNLQKDNITTRSSLLVTDSTILNNVGITGTISTGMLTVDGFSASVSTVGLEPLRLQTNPLAGIELMNGKVAIDPIGKLRVEELEVGQLRISGEGEGDATIGSGTIIAGSTEVFVYTSVISDNSKVFVTAKSKTGGQALVVESKQVGVGFQVIVESTFSEDIWFDWWVIN